MPNVGSGGFRPGWTTRPTVEPGFRHLTAWTYHENGYRPALGKTQLRICLARPTRT